MTEDDHRDLFSRLDAMSESELVALDAICDALQHHQESSNPGLGYFMATRIVALAAVDLMWAWDTMMRDRE